MSKYTVQREEYAVTICMNEDCNFLDGFLDIYTNNSDYLSPFKDLDDAELFARIIIKLLDVVTV